MKSIRRFSLLKVLVLAIAIMGASAIPAHAQRTTGTFSLAHKVRWAEAVLPAGNYEFSLDSQNWPVRVTVRQLGGSMVAMLMAQEISDEKLGDSSILILHEDGGEAIVSVLRLQSIGMALQFAHPKVGMPVAETAGLTPLADSQPTK